MTTRTLLITVPGSGDSTLCGSCPFLRRYAQTGRAQCKMPLPGWDYTEVGFWPEERHAACLAAERGAKAANDAMVLAAIRAGRTTPIPPGGDRSRLREVHDHLTTHGLPALDRLDAEGDNV